MRGSFGQFIPDRIRVLAQRTQIYNRYAAKKLARRSRRLDLCAAQFAHLLHRVPGMSLEKARCLEIGSGWVLTHPLICYLLGAQTVTATDILPLAQPRYLRDAVRESDASLVREVLSPYSPYERVRERLSRIHRMDRFSFSSLEELGISYLAPVDIAKEPLPGTFDFIYSFDVLEHVPRQDLGVFLSNLSRSLAPTGCMVHAIHTEDHRDSKSDPLAFLSISQDSSPDPTQMLRGTRLRRNEWISVFQQIPEIKFTILYEWYRLDQGVPVGIDPSVTAHDESDLRIAYLGILGSRK